MNKGFTLVEVLAVIIILAAIALVSIFSVDGIVKIASQKSYESQINEIKHNAENFVNVELLPSWCDLVNDNDYCFITLRFLAHKKYIKLDDNGEFINPATDEAFSLETLVKVSKYGSNHLFEVIDDIEKFANNNVAVATRAKQDALKNSAQIYFDKGLCGETCEITVATLVEKNILETDYYSAGTRIIINNGQVTIE